jgi:hypothetical protein
LCGHSSCGSPMAVPLLAGFRGSVTRMDGAFEEIDRLAMINTHTICTTFNWRILYHRYFVLTQVIMTTHSQQAKGAGRIIVPRQKRTSSTSVSSRDPNRPNQLSSAASFLFILTVSSSSSPSPSSSSFPPSSSESSPESSSQSSSSESPRHSLYIRVRCKPLARFGVRDVGHRHLVPDLGSP